MACRFAPQKAPDPGSLQEAIQGGNIRFEGNGNLTYGVCMDPTAKVTMTIDTQAKEFEGNTYPSYINPVTVNAVTYGVFSSLGDCEKRNHDKKTTGLEKACFTRLRKNRVLRLLDQGW